MVTGVILSAGKSYKRRNWTPEEDERLRTLRTNGVSWFEISEEFGIPPRTCSHHYYKLLETSELS